MVMWQPSPIYKEGEKKPFIGWTLRAFSSLVGCFCLFHSLLCEKVKMVADEEKALQEDHNHEDSIPEFFGEEEDDSPSSLDPSDDQLDCDCADNHQPSLTHSKERAAYWESQESLLQEMLEHYWSSGSKLRQEIMGVIEMAKETSSCECSMLRSSSCANCLRKRVVDLLCNKGLHVSLCTSKWKRSPKIPGGKHEYIEVMSRTAGRKKRVPIVIEMGFRDEFKMAKACDEYHKLVDELPEMYIGKVEHLQAMLRILCSAAKRSAREKDIHMGPWRKKSFMQMKWPASKLSHHHDHPSSDSNPQLASSTTQVHASPVASCFQFPTAASVKVA